MLKYDLNKNNDYYHRLEMCEYIGRFEGTEIADAVSALCAASSVLRGIGERDEYEIPLLLAERICRNFISYLRFEDPSCEQYDEINVEVFKHFAGGADKLPLKKNNQ